MLDKHRRVFEDLPPGVPPDRGFEHIIELVRRAPNPSLPLLIVTPGITRKR